MLDHTFITGGKATFTIELPADFSAKNDASPHYTYKVSKKEAVTVDDRDVYFIALLTGPQNDADYTYLGILNPRNGGVKLTRKSRLTDDSMAVRILRRTLARIWSDEQDIILEHGFDINHCGKCGMCGRKLTTPASIECGIGPVCLEKLAA